MTVDRRPETTTQPGAMLAGDADRERAIDVLKAGFAEGRLTKAEYDERVTRVHAARTYADLAPLVADLQPARSAASWACQPRHTCLLRQRSVRWSAPSRWHH